MLTHNFAVFISACTQAFIFMIMLVFLKLARDERGLSDGNPRVYLSSAILLLVLFLSQGYVSLSYILGVS